MDGDFPVRAPSLAAVRGLQVRERALVKMIQATVESFRQGDVAEALRETAASGATISTLWSGEPPVACVRFDVVVHDDLVDRVVDAVVRGARAGKGRPTRGSVLVVPVLEALRIRTGEIDEAAIA